MYLFFLEIGSIALGVSAVIFLILYVVEWKQRIKEEHEYREAREKDIHDYEHRMEKVEEAVEIEKEWTDQFIRNHPQLGPEIKDILLSELKAGKHRTKLPFETEKSDG